MSRGDQGDMLIGVLAEFLSIIGGDRSPADKIEELEATITAHGRHPALEEACNEYGKNAHNG